MHPVRSSHCPLPDTRPDHYLFGTLASPWEERPGPDWAEPVPLPRTVFQTGGREAGTEEARTFNSLRKAASEREVVLRSTWRGRSTPALCHSFPITRVLTDLKWKSFPEFLRVAPILNPDPFYPSLMDR